MYLTYYEKIQQKFTDLKLKVAYNFYAIQII